MLYLVLIALLAAIPIALLSPGHFLWGWLGASLLLTGSFSLLYWVWRKTDRQRLLAWMMALTFVLRLGGGIGLSQAYQAWGYDKPVYHAGYLFADAFDRDQEAFSLGETDVNLLHPGLKLGADQYGGLGRGSALLYRVLSSDAHRPYLMLILAAAAMTFGLPFLYKATARRWGERTALLAGWIYVLYPDGIFFTASQMREPFIIGLSALALWGALEIPARPRSGWLIFLLALAAIVPISPPAAAFIAISYGMLIWIESSPGRLGTRGSLLTLAGLGLGALAFALVTWGFFREAAGWDATLAVSGSGMLASFIEQIPGRLRLPFITLYGLTRPLLPAAIFEPSIPLAKTVILVRALGWYLLLPLLAYAPLAVRFARAGVARLRGLWLTLLPWLWLLIASLRAGGDESDNPRYRLILFCLICISAAWGYAQAREQRDRWFGRLLLAEGVFLLMFSQWYVARYLQIWLKLSLMTNLIVTGVLIGLIFAGGLLSDWLRERREARSEPPRL